MILQTNKDTDEGFISVKSKKHKNKGTGRAAAKFDKILKMTLLKKKNFDDVEITSVKSDSENEILNINEETFKQENS